jgi:ubiquinone/menaquinone biosynthesis C-methylase UbiE
MGGTPQMWSKALEPRLATYLPTGTILELAPGHGRVSQYLKDMCDRLVLVDLAENCIEGCRQRFAGAANIDYYVNDGRSLAMIPDESVDLIVSWDSLVHVEMDVLGGYLSQFRRILKPDGTAWLHHSNLATLRIARRLSVLVPDQFRQGLVDRDLVLDLAAWRASSVSADRVADFCEMHGLFCQRQEWINWMHGPYLMDAISTIKRRDALQSPEREVVRNRRFPALPRPARATSANQDHVPTGNESARIGPRLSRAAIEARTPWLLAAARRLPDPARDALSSAKVTASVGSWRPVRWGSLRRTAPVNNDYGRGRGTSVDRWYINEFMSANADAMTGRILELQNGEWSSKYRDPATSTVTVLDVNPNNPEVTYLADLNEPDSIQPASFDCVVVPQTLQYLSDLVVSLRTLGRAVCAGGTVLVTMPTISKLDASCGPDADLWRLTPSGLARLIETALPDATHAVSGFGNVLTAVAFLEGLAAEELSAAELAYHDPDFPLLACARIVV